MIKALFHCHTTYSDDGKLSCKELIELGNKHNFNYIFLSDHFEHINNQSYNQLIAECKQVNQGSKCQLIPGYEKSWEGYHICAYNLNEWTNSSNFSQWCELVHQQGGIVVSVHPGKYKFDIPQKFLKECDGVEIWNSKWPYDGKFYPNPKAVDLVSHHFMLAGQDVHKKGDFNDLAVYIDAPDSISSTEVIEAVKLGKHKIKGKYLNFSKSPSKRFKYIFQAYQKARLFIYFSAYNLKKKIL
jgi:hypothetical protein